MTQEENIVQLAARAKAAIEALGDAITAAAPESRKEAFADVFKVLVGEIEAIGGQFNA